MSELNLQGLRKVHRVREEADVDVVRSIDLAPPSPATVARGVHAAAAEAAGRLGGAQPGGQGVREPHQRIQRRRVGQERGDPSAVARHAAAGAAAAEATSRPRPGPARPLAAAVRGADHGGGEGSR